MSYFSHPFFFLASFEDKRKENYDKGQAELERRRKQLADIQKKEQEERERKERDEADKREKVKNLIWQFCAHAIVNYFTTYIYVGSH
jgi:hypothetical protein